MVKENIFGKLMISILGAFFKIREMASECINGMMEEFTEDSGRLIE
jgi:hypothetical protein